MKRSLTNGSCRFGFEVICAHREAGCATGGMVEGTELVLMCSATETETHLYFLCCLITASQCCDVREDLSEKFTVGTYLQGRVEDSKHTTSRAMDLDRGCGAHCPKCGQCCTIYPRLPKDACPSKWQSVVDFRTIGYLCTQSLAMELASSKVTCCHPRGTWQCRGCTLASQGYLTAFPSSPSPPLFYSPAARRTVLDSTRNPCGEAAALR